MDIGLILGLLKVSIETFKDERKDRFLKKYVKLEREHNEELAKAPDDVSDLALDTIMFECKALGKLVVAEANK